MMKHKLIITGVISMLLAAPIAHAQNIVIEQKNKKFSEKKVTITLGDSLTFVNAEDEVVHNIYSTSKGNAFDIRKQVPGSREVVTFKHKGKAKVRCAIHPKMKIKVTIE